MTQRTAWQHRQAEIKAALMSRVANRLFTFREDGLDGFLKRRLLASDKRDNRYRADSRG